MSKFIEVTLKSTGSLYAIRVEDIDQVITGIDTSRIYMKDSSNFYVKERIRVNQEGELYVFKANS